MEDYKKKYEDALKVIKENLNALNDVITTGGDVVNIQPIRDCFYKAFPELAESEDERIRKELIGFIENWKNPNNLGRPQDYPMFTKNEEQCNKYITWLEKQGQKPQGKSALEAAKEVKIDNQNCINSNSKVEPEFKVGDWIIFTRKDGTREMLQVSDIIDDRYYFNNVLHGSWSVKECNETCHLWSIEDAKPGDVLAAHECIVLFKEIDGLNIKCHCAYHFMNNPSFYVNTLQNKSAFHPATKGQRELLFQKMKEAGYKWENNQLEEINNKGFVDLGLPSGTLWAACNLGAEKETDFGKFFQWGDTQGYSGVDEHQFNWNNYKWETSGNLSKYNENDTKLILDDEDDPVFVATNGMFKMPTKEQLQELIDHTNHEWIENFKESGVNGMKFINKKDNTEYIFIPAAGYCCNSNHDSVGSWGYVWSSSRDFRGPDYAWNVYFSNSGKVNMYSDYRFFGSSVRGVKNP